MLSNEGAYTLPVCERENVKMNYSHDYFFVYVGSFVRHRERVSEYACVFEGGWRGAWME